MKTVLKSLTFAILSSLAAVSYAEMNHTMDHSSHDAMAAQPKMFMEKTQIDGYTVSFHVMQAKEGMQHGGSHNLMIKVEQGGRVLNDITANSKVASPDGKESSKMLMKMGDWYMAGYDLASAGKYQLMVLFKTADGQKHFGGIHYMP
ncbi:MAG: hypothetical protein JMN27_11125 [gamma proteobacterium endosymbiont of Lamellibrachia anaximandri]|nr:hypothetical protein [gamma proteobacterium endosymbiont of Lamellibrachia anaximandri]MBL3534375.1 hypothetical protein [gamma proteobacterium endosymbiont of Lamellibrachia anaximandri]MBL3600053.1 hypothetical protein [gamma proteobacterium endosymbiont of Lamellibrachia anaximandri]